MDRERLADIVHLVRDLEGFDGLYLFGDRATVVIANDRSRARAAARVTVLRGVGVNIASTTSACRQAKRISFSEAELSVAAKRDEARRAAWLPLRLGVDLQTDAARAKTLLIVSASPATDAAVLRARASGPFTTYGTSAPSQVTDMLSVYALPHVIVIDSNLEGTEGLHKRVCELFPSRFRAFGNVQWMSSKKGLSDHDVDRILDALGLRARPALAREDPFSRVRIISVGDALLGREVSAAAPGAEVQVVSGWEAIDRIAEGDVDVIVAGEIEDVGLASLVRFARRCENTPVIVIANDQPKSTRMRAIYPHIAHYFVDRPVCTDDLLRVLRA